jgi:PTH1 family peptidyl-tRNA hydrolase
VLFRSRLFGGRRLLRRQPPRQNKPGAAPAEAVFVVVGLGNPGKEYEATRHNAGFKVADSIAGRIGAPIKRAKFRALVGEGRHAYEGRSAGARVVLVKPQTFMNVSGASVAQAIRFYKADLSRLILVFDDVDIPFGSVRVRAAGGPGTHNGMRSVIAWLGGKEGFPRVRVGIGKPPGEMDIKDYVLGRVSAAERAQMSAAYDRAASAALDVIEFGIDKAMNMHN